mmetsp:Transcript_40754/g.85613  ORF Transcript_40754/g.85613 Transcript_40754/m.85613 type:complete len:283 (-) Transcript_40754:114-962(-)
MSLFAVSTAAISRHLRRHLISNATASHPLRISGGNVPSSSLARRNLSSTDGVQGSGLRRAQTKGRRPASQPRAASSSSTVNSNSSSSSRPQTSDPHSIANEMVSNAAGEGRTPGVESVATLTREQKISNYAMAAGLLGFVSYVFYYSLASVGGGKNAKALIFGEDTTQQQQTEGGEEGGSNNPGFEEFLKEANEGRSMEEQRLRAESEARGEARELAELESSTSARLKAEGVGEDVIVAGSMSDEEEREMAKVAGFEGGESKEAVKTKRPLWKRVVFFWRRE